MNTDNLRDGAELITLVCLFCVSLLGVSPNVI
jgi:hypothetical protein